MGRWIGSYGWEHGPIVLAPPAARERWKAGFTKADGDLLAAVRKRASSLELPEGEALVFPKGRHSSWLPIDGSAGMLVRRKGYLPPDLIEELFGSLHASFFDGWRKIGEWSLDGPRVWVDTVAYAVGGHDDRVELDEALARSRCTEALALELEPGTYVLHVSLTTLAVGSREVEMEAIRFLREGRDAPQLAAAVRPKKPDPITAPPKAAELAEDLRFVGTDGGPLVLVHEKELEGWRGVLGEDDQYVDEPGDADYWRACVPAGRVIEGVRGVRALSLEGPIAHAFVPTDDGGVFLAWQGADSAAGCVAALLAQPESAWEPTDERWESTGPAWLFDANRDGRELDREAWIRVELPPGDHRISVLPGFDGEVKHEDGRVEPVSITAVRLAR